MSSEYDKEQDQKIDQNAAAIAQLTGYIREIRNHFEPILAFVEKVPARWKAAMRILRAVFGLAVVSVALVKGGGWYFNRMKIKRMAERYVQVARDLYYKENNPDVAIPFIEKAIALDDDNPDYLYFKDYINGMSATRKLLNLDRPFTKNELDEAHRAYADAKLLEQLAPERADAYILQGQILAALKETARAREAVCKAVELDAKNDFAWMRLALIQLDEKDVEGAKKSLERAAKLKPFSKWVFLWKGLVARDYDKNVAEARACYEKALAVDPKFDMALYNLGWTYMGKAGRDYAKAREYFQQVLRVNPDYKEACYAIGMAYGYQDNYPVAKVWMEKSVALDPGFLTGHKWSGIVSGEMKDYAEAIACFGRAIMLDPMNADLYVRRAKMESALGQLDVARRDLEFALELDPKAKRSYLYLAELIAKQGRTDEALAAYDKALAIDAEYAEAHAGRATLLASLGRKDEALAAIAAAIRCARDKPAKFEAIKARIMKSDANGS